MISIVLLQGSVHHWLWGRKKKDKVRNLEQLYENEKYRIEIIMEGKWKVKNLPGVVLVSVECLL
jgi:hypothetical protein